MIAPEVVACVHASLRYPIFSNDSIIHSSSIALFSVTILFFTIEMSAGDTWLSLGRECALSPFVFVA